MNTLHDVIGGLRRASLVVAIATGTMLCAGTVQALLPVLHETLKGTYGLRVSGEVLQGTVADPTSTVAAGPRRRRHGNFRR